MYNKCNKVLALTLDTGQEITHNFQDHIGNGKQFELELKSLDGQKLGTCSTHYYFFDKEGHLNGKALDDNQWTFSNLTNPFLLVKKDAQGKFEFTIHGEDGRAFDLEEKSIMGIKNIDLEKYVNAEKPQIYIKPSEYDQKNNKAIKAFLYDIDNNKIGSLSTSILYSGSDGSDDVLHMSYHLYHNDQHLVSNFLPSTNNVFAEKIDGEFKINQPDNWLEASSYTRDYNNLDVDYDLLDKILMEQQKNDPYCQIEKLCKELDETQFAMDGTHHDCINLI